MSAVLEWLKIRDYKYVIEVTFNGMAYLQKSMKICQFVQKLLEDDTGGQRQTYRQTAW
jgi:hypothetical protein